VKLFASVRQALGRSLLELELPEGATVTDLRAQLQSQFAQLHLENAGVLVAVNLRYAKPDQVLHDKDEVALIPPVGGG
jgi:molybdopterin converting factor subunit 1